MIHLIFGTIHIISLIFICAYPYIVVKNNLYDYIYITFSILLQYVWILCCNRCPINYAYLNYTNNFSCGKKYKSGEVEIEHCFDYLLTSIGLETNSNKLFNNFVAILMNVLVLVAIIIVAFRQSAVNPYFILFVCIFLRLFYSFYNSFGIFNAGVLDAASIGTFLFGKNYSIFKDLYYKLNLHTEINTLLSVIYIISIIYITYKNRKTLGI